MVLGIPGRLKYLEGTSSIPEAGGLRYILQILDTNGEYPPNEESIKKRWPLVELSYKQFYRAQNGKLKLGDIQTITVQSDTIVVNMIASENKKINIDALKECLKKVTKDATYDGGSAHLNMLRGKYWQKIEKSLTDILMKAGINVTVYQ